MATWHQSRRKGRQLYHDTQWTVLTDPPGGFTSMMLFDTQAEAQAFLPKAGAHSYILPPASHYKASRDADVNPRMEPVAAREILAELGLREDTNYMLLPAGKAAEIAEYARKYGYRKSRSAPGATARMFLQYLQRQAVQSHRNPGVNPPKYPAGIESVQRERLNAGGYNSQGHYFGGGQALFRVYLTNGDTEFIRGHDRTGVLQHLQQIVKHSRDIDEIARRIRTGWRPAPGIDPGVNPSRGGEYDDVAARELEIYADNDHTLYTQRRVPIIENMRRKIKSGKYNPALAPKLWRYYYDEAAKRYSKEFGGSFNVATRQRLAEERAKDEYEKLIAGEYGSDIVPTKKLRVIDPDVNPTIRGTIRRGIRRTAVAIHKATHHTYIIEGLMIPRSKTQAIKFWYYCGLKEVNGENRGVFDDNRSKAMHYRKEGDAVKQMRSLRNRLPQGMHQLRVVPA